MIAVADLLTHLRLPSDTDATTQVYITDLEEHAVAFAERELGVFLGTEDTAYVEYLIGRGTDTLWPEHIRGTVTSLLERSEVGGTATTITAGDSDGFVVREGKIIRKAGLVWTKGYEYQVTGTRGYSSGSEPDEAQQLVMGLVGHWFTKRLPIGSVGLSASTNELPLHLQQIIAGKKRLRV